MKILSFNFILFFFIIAVPSCMAQKKDSAGIAGTWKGTSLCQVKNSPCHDETVVYHFTKSATEENRYSLQANKIVDGKEEDMGVLEFVYDNSKKTLTCNMTSKQGRPGVWLFNVDGNKIHGTLILGDNTLYRIIEVEKNQQQ